MVFIVEFKLHCMQEHRDNNDIHESLPFLSKYTGYVIGKNGRGIQNLLKKSGAKKLWVANDCQIHFDDAWAYLHMIGHPMNNDAAKCLLMQRIRDAETNSLRELQEESLHPHGCKHRRT